MRLNTGGEYPEEVIREWLKRFPSTLPKDWTWEKSRAQWAQGYLEYMLWRMSVKLPLEFDHASNFQSDATTLALDFAEVRQYRQPWEGAYTLPEKVQIWNELVEWANSARGRLVWDEQLNKYKVDETKARLPDKWQKLDPAKVKGESELPKIDPTADYPEYKEADEKARKSWEQALGGKGTKEPSKNQEKQ